jgi:hypothetical protein
MIIIKCKKDLLKIADISVRDVVEMRSEFWLEDDKYSIELAGYLILLENQKDDIRDLPHLNKEDGGLTDSSFWECCDVEEGVCFVVIVCNNDFAIEFAIPMDDNIDPQLLSLIDKYQIENVDYIEAMKKNQQVALSRTEGK